MNVVHSSIADSGEWVQKNKQGQLRGHAAVALLYYIRFLDQESDSHRGNGRADINLATAASTLGKSISTISRWIRHGYRLGLFRHKPIKLSPGNYRIYYTAINKIAVAHGLDGLGACGRVGLEALTRLRFISTELEAQQLQKQSRHAELKKKKGDPKKVPTAHELMTPCELGARGILSARGRFVFLANSFRPHGGSQKTLAHRQGRHISTVQRRLSTTYRERHGLEPIPKMQLVAEPLYYPRIGDGDPKQLVPGQRLITGPYRQLFRLCPNVYKLDHELCPLRYRRSQLKRALVEQSLSLDDDWKLHPDYQQMLSSWREAQAPLISSTYSSEARLRGKHGHLKSLSIKENREQPQGT